MEGIPKIESVEDVRHGANQALDVIVTKIAQALPQSMPEAQINVLRMGIRNGGDQKELHQNIDVLNKVMVDNGVELHDKDIVDSINILRRFIQNLG